MTVNVAIDLGYEFTVKADVKTVFDLLSDVPKSVSHFPKVKKLTDLGDSSYRWEMQKVGAGQASLQTVYASHYVADRAKGSVVWTPVEGEGNALIGGSWKIKKAKIGTAIAFKVDGTVMVPVPGLMKMVVAPVVQSEFESLVEKYIDALIKVFGGEV